MGLTKYKLGKLIEKLDNKNSDLEYGVEYARGVSNDKELMPTKADLNGRDLKKFSVIHPGDFVYNHRTSRHGDKFCIAYNTTQENVICTEDYTIFRIKDDCKSELLTEWLYMYFHRPEMDRFVMYSSWGSSTEFFNWDDVCDIEIDIPPLPTQQKHVDIYKAMVANQQSYERGLDDLKLVCDAYIEDLRRKMPCEKIGKYLIPSDRRNNIGLDVDAVRGIATSKELISTKADMDGVGLLNYKIVPPQHIAYVPDTSRRGDKISLAMNRSQDTYMVSSISTVFTTNKDKILPEYLMLFFTRTEFDRYSRFNSWGSAREALEWDAMCDFTIPIPDINVQKSITEIYNVYIKRKDINEQLKAQIKDICPILIKGSLEEGKR